MGPYYAILPSDGCVQKLYQQAGLIGTAVPAGFAYSSGSNPEFLEVGQLRELIRQHVDQSLSQYE